MTYKIGVRPKIKEKPVKITLYLDEKYRDDLRELAGADKRSPSQYVENMIAEAKRKAKGRKKGESTSGSAGSARHVIAPSSDSTASHPPAHHLPARMSFGGSFVEQPER